MKGVDGVVKEGRWETGRAVQWFEPGTNPTNQQGFNTGQSTPNFPTNNANTYAATNNVNPATNLGPGQNFNNTNLNANTNASAFKPGGVVGR